MRNRSLPGSQVARCGFFSLPRELRDMIYSYALYQPGGLYFHRDELYKAKLCASEDTTEEFNALKSTSKQLRHETLGLELKLHNDLIFVKKDGRNGHYVEKTPQIQFLGFLDMCHEVWRRFIRRVYIRDCSEWKDTKAEILDVHLVVHLCHNYPEWLVFWYLPVRLGHDTAPRFLATGFMFLITTLRPGQPRKIWGICTALKIPVVLGERHIAHRIWRPDLRMPDYNAPSIEAPNFRILLEYRPFDAEGFRRDSVDYLSNVTPTLTREATDGLADAWVAIARDWYTNGF